MPRWPKYCTPLCNQLRCSKKAKGRIIQLKNKKVVECLFVPGDYCTGRNCNYSYCLKRSFRDDGKCGQWVAMQNRNKMIDDDLDENMEDYIEEDIPAIKKIQKKYPRLKSKAIKKIKNYDRYDDF
ncbi:MAG: hypothetical protein ACTSWR_10175 [Candidatus Helarchaeota archaeon]